MIADGAAFVPEMNTCMAAVSSPTGNTSVFAPESFEYLILKSNILEVPSDILEQTYNYADSTRYFSWEEYFTHYLTERSQGTVYQFSKRKLPTVYLTAGNADKLKSTIPDCIELSEGKHHLPR